MWIPSLLVLQTAVTAVAAGSGASDLVIGDTWTNFVLHAKPKFQGDGVYISVTSNRCYNLHDDCFDSQASAISFEASDGDGSGTTVVANSNVTVSQAKLLVYADKDCLGKNAMFPVTAESSPADLSSVGLDKAISAFRVVGGNWFRNGVRSGNTYKDDGSSQNFTCRANTRTTTLDQWKGGEVTLMELPDALGRSLTIPIDRPRVCLQLDPKVWNGDVVTFQALAMRNMPYPDSSEDVRGLAMLRLYSRDNCTGQYVGEEIFDLSRDGAPAVDTPMTTDKYKYTMPHLTRKYDVKAAVRSVLLEFDGAIAEDRVAVKATADAAPSPKPASPSASSSWKSTLQFTTVDGSNVSYVADKSQVCYNIGCVENGFNLSVLTGTYPESSPAGTRPSALIAFYELADCSLNGSLAVRYADKLVSDSYSQQMPPYVSSFMVWESSTQATGPLVQDKCPTKDKVATSLTDGAGNGDPASTNEVDRSAGAKKKTSGSGISPTTNFALSVIGSVIALQMAW